MGYEWLSIKDTQHAVGEDHRTLCGVRRENYLFPAESDRECPDCVRLLERAVHQHD